MLNHINIMGRLVAAPELRVTSNGTKVASFRIACDRDYGEDKTADFIDIVAWRGTAEFVCRNFAKGQPALISGRLQIREWTDRDGGKRRSAEIVADNVYFCGGTAAEKKAAATSSFTELDDDGELPFSMDDDGELPL